MSWVRWLAPLLLALGVAWLVAGGGACGVAASPQLVQVLDVAPRQVEVGERVAILGAGFPPGKPARITFRGTLHRPGQRAETDAAIVTTGTVVGPDHVELLVGEATQALFCGAGERALHTTFEGDVEVAFAAAAPGAPPVAGELRHLVFDVRPGATAADAERAEEGRRLLAWMGLRVEAGGSGLAVQEVTPGSRAEVAGLAAGDVIAAFDGVRVETVADAVPASGARDATLAVRRGGAPLEVTRTVPVDGFRRAPPTELLGAGLLVLAALVVVLLFGGPAWGAGWIAALASRLRARAEGGGTAKGTGWQRLGRSLAAAARDALPPLGPTAVVDAGVCALLAAMPFGQYLVAAQLDVGLLFVAASTALATAALLSSPSPLRGVRAALHVAWQHVPAACAVTSLVLVTGSLRVQELEHAQGGWPTDWLAFRSPVALASLLLLLGVGLVEPDAPHALAGLAAHVGDPTSGARPRRGAWFQAACRAHRLVVAGLASALFLGGWVLPGSSPAAQDARPLLEVAGAAWLLVKTWGLVALLAWTASVLPCRTLAERSRRTALVLVPFALGVLAVAAVWTSFNLAGAGQALVEGTLVAAVVLGGAAVAQRVRHGLDAARSEGHLSPFL
ncbi:MAG TPA: NADH-quinone oxidoreductase subunit H [Polyangiaceae bacterium]|jgi:NADH-quinone oxidoreductase subunit H